MLYLYAWVSVLNAMSFHIKYRIRTVERYCYPKIDSICFWQLVRLKSSYRISAAIKMILKVIITTTITIIMVVALQLHC